MKEIGGYFGLEEYEGREYHPDALALNTGRNCLRYLIRSKNIQKLALPVYDCGVVEATALEEKVDIIHYDVAMDLTPLVSDIDEDAWLYLVNYYGQNTEEIRKIAEARQNIIVDNAQAFFTEPMEKVDTLYTCRKYFGVPDGAYLYTDAPVMDLEEDHSGDRRKWINGRYEYSASRYFEDYRNGEDQLQSLPIRKMSRLTHDLLRPINYEAVRTGREQNFMRLDSALKNINQLKPVMPQGPYMYPLLLKSKKAMKLRKYLVQHRIYSATLWPKLLDQDPESSAYRLAQGIVNLPCDQRYTAEDMDNIIQTVFEGMGE